MTGLAAGLASGALVIEASPEPGGICASYYLEPGTPERQHRTFTNPRAYRFEIGGGHWMWGADALIYRLLESIAPFQKYERRASVYLPTVKGGLLVPYPIQHHLRWLGADLAARCASEVANTPPVNGRPTTMREWLVSACGPTLSDLFFGPFHDLYTAGLWTRVAPQDPSKSPIDRDKVIRSATEDVSAAGYNTSFMYPEGGFGRIAGGLADRCRISYDTKAVAIDLKKRQLRLADGSTISYEVLLSTIPLIKLMQLCGLDAGAPADPYTSVLVLNLGARKGRGCPDDHWVYVPSSSGGFHRVGFYSNVDASFLPERHRADRSHAAIYIEKAVRGGQELSFEEQSRFRAQAIEQLQDWKWIEDVEVADLTYVDVAYTWTMPGSRWRDKAVAALQPHGIFPIGRYGRWASAVTDQGLAQSIRDGLMAGASIRA